MTQFKPGDRVRVTYEGEVYDTSSSSHLKVKTKSQSYSPFLNDPAVTIEKIREPEPKWQHGDTVKTPSLLPLMWYGGSATAGPGWRGVGGSESVAFDQAVSEAWQNGTLKVLHKVNA